MDNTLVLCGGTGAHVGLALLRLHTLGYALGFFDQQEKPFDFPRIFLVDQDAGPGRERQETAWQLARDLVGRHPGAHDWSASTGSAHGPELLEVTPLPVGPRQDWFKPPFSTLASRFERSPLLPALASGRQRQIDYSKGMMGSPAIGSLLFRLKQYDERGKDRNYDQMFGQLLARQGRIVVAGSGVGGTGASVGPTLARRLAEPAGNQVMAVMILNWFRFVEDQTEVDEERRAKAQLRNRIMRQNANSALEFYGQSLAREVAAVPVGMPERSLALRTYTGDLGQPHQESYIHAVAAQCAVRHFLARQAYGSGLYIMGAVESGRLDARTAIPGGTLQDLANQAVTLAEMLALWQRVLASVNHGHVTPAIYDAVAAVADPAQVADGLGEILANYRAQISWMGATLGVTGASNRDLTRESESRRRLGAEHRTLPVAEGAPPAAVAAALFDWTARWVREIASPANGLRVAPGEVHGGQWPDLRYEGIGAAAKVNGDLTRISDANIAAVLEAFVDRGHLSSNGWPHPLAAADYFDHALRHGDRVALRQLELLLCGLAAGVLELRPLASGEPAESGLSLEALANEYRRQGQEGLAELGIFLREGAATLVGFNSPHSLLCPVPRLDDEDEALWQGLWTTLTGARDGARWSEAVAPQSWGSHDLSVRQVRSWIAVQKRVNPDTAPAWTQAFQGYFNQAETTFSNGPFVPVYWESGGTPRVVRLSLPVHDGGGSEPPPGTPPIEEAEVLQRVPELAALLDSERRELFSSFELKMPDREGTVRVWWDEHLDLLRQRGRLAVCARTKAGALLVGLRKENVLHSVVFDNSLVLRRADVVIATCTPFYQDPLPGSPNPPGEKYPDIPLRSDYLDLVKFPDGDDLLGRIATGKEMQSPSWLPTRGRDPHGRPQLRWDLHLKGRGQPLAVELRLESDTAAKDLHRAHFMVWPRFRTPTGAGWKAYYLYERCTDPRLFCDTIWLEAAASRLHRRRHDGTEYPYPLSLGAGPNSVHTGGPPLALALRNIKTNDEQGLYLVQLEPRKISSLTVALGIDFGTSHSVAAVRSSPGEAPQQVKLLPELDPANAGCSLTLHVSEDQGHVRDVFERAGILANGSWLPTYRERGEGILPSELLLRRTLKEAQADALERWQPVRDFTIPPMDIVRSNLSEHVLTDFKWDTASDFFKGSESQLREHYLGLFLELVMADVINNHLPGFPEKPVNVTFTYPLRSGEPQFKSLGESLTRLLRRANASFGLRLQLQPAGGRSADSGDDGRYDESRAARVPTERSGEVCLVADLGGGTLDLFIAPYRQEDVSAATSRRGDSGGSTDGTGLLEVADSVRLGGNLVLRHMAEHPERYLPRDGGWLKGDARARETGLRAWMRSRGSASLFGFEKGDGLKLAEMDLQGFANPAEAGLARELLDRYFRLIVEYMARNLTAYLAKHWLVETPAKHRDKLRISVQLRGNGWRLWYHRQSYVQITQAIQDEVRQRLVELWPLVDGNPYPVPADDKYWERAARYAVSDPKPGPVKNVVGRAMSFQEVSGRWFTHTLTDLEVLRKGDFTRVAWYSRVPFDTGAARQVELGAITPPLMLSGAKSDEKVEICNLEADLQGRVNSALQHEGQPDGRSGTFLAPVAPLVWEAVFKSPQFWPDGQAG
jgi:hypothetical protein